MPKRIDITQNAQVTDIMADVDFSCEGEADFSEAIQVILREANGKKNLDKGKYNLRMLAVVTRED